MPKISEHFNRSEFECECGCGFATADVEQVVVLEDLHSHFSGIYGAVYIEITGPCRCHKHNEKTQLEDDPEYIPGSSRSKHMQGIACDFKVWIRWHEKQVPADDVAQYLENQYPNKYGIGRYSNRTHLDVRPTAARWDKR